MPPRKSKQRLSATSKISVVTSPKPTVMERVRTPDRSPIKKRLQITQRQKQALVDNLQLEGERNNPSFKKEPNTNFRSHRARQEASGTIRIAGTELANAY